MKYKSVHGSAIGDLLFGVKNLGNIDSCSIYFFTQRVVIVDVMTLLGDKTKNLALKHYKATCLICCWNCNDIRS